MKLPFLNIWITRTDWKRECAISEFNHDLALVTIDNLRNKLSKYKRPRDEQGRFLSKKAETTAQLKAEVASGIPHWDDIRKAGK